MRLVAHSHASDMHTLRGTGGGMSRSRGGGGGMPAWGERRACDWSCRPLSRFRCTAQRRRMRARRVSEAIPLSRCVAAAERSGGVWCATSVLGEKSSHSPRPPGDTLRYSGDVSNTLRYSSNANTLSYCGTIKTSQPRPPPVNSGTLSGTIRFLRAATGA